MYVATYTVTIATADQIKTIDAMADVLRCEPYLAVVDTFTIQVDVSYLVCQLGKLGYDQLILQS